MGNETKGMASNAGASRTPVKSFSPGKQAVVGVGEGEREPLSPGSKACENQYEEGMDNG